MSNPKTKSASTVAAGESPKLSESEYLKQQGEAARNAIAKAFEDLKSDLGHGVDPREWIKTHPWITLASATVAGFAAAATVVPSKEEQALRKLQAIERAIHGERPKSENGHAAAEGDQKKETGGLMALILRELIGAVKPVIVAAVAAKMSPQDPPPPPPDADAPNSSGQDS
jgi:hypothetical protein